MVCIKGFEGRYTINEQGNIYSIKRKKFLKSRVQKSGYIYVTLCKNYKQYNFMLHRLIANTFILNPDKKPCVNHKDGNKLNNKISNLEWCSYSENIKHAFDNNLINLPKGIHHHNSKKVGQYTKKGQLIKIWDSVADAARYLQCNPDCINRTCRGIRKTYLKFVWNYI